MLFEERIGGPEDWGKIFCRKESFEPMIRAILETHRLEYRPAQNCAPGSNAVFRTGNYVVKIFAPGEAQIGDAADYEAEKFGVARANALGIPAPKLYGAGALRDRYLFRYLILEYVEAKPLSSVVGSLSEQERRALGGRLRGVVDEMDMPCPAFCGHRLLGERAQRRWRAFPEGFQKERAAYIERYIPAPPVYNHGDLNPDNILLDGRGKLYLIDFADSLLAPAELELAGLACEGFRFDRACLEGFFGAYEKEELAEKLLYGCLIHDFGANIIRDNIGKEAEINSVDVLRGRIIGRL